MRFCLFLQIFDLHSFQTWSCTSQVLEVMFVTVDFLKLKTRSFPFLGLF